MIYIYICVCVCIEHGISVWINIRAYIHIHVFNSSAQCYSITRMVDCLKRLLNYSISWECKLVWFLNVHNKIFTLYWNCQDVTWVKSQSIFEVISFILDSFESAKPMIWYGKHTKEPFLNFEADFRQRLFFIFSTICNMVLNGTYGPWIKADILYWSHPHWAESKIIIWSGITHFNASREGKLCNKYIRHVFCCQ